MMRRRKTGVTIRTHAVLTLMLFAPSLLGCATTRQTPWDFGSDGPATGPRADASSPIDTARHFADGLERDSGRDKNRDAARDLVVETPDAQGRCQENDPCDDGDPCTSADVCRAGICTGTRYVCDDQLSCTTDRCDGQGGCTAQLKPGFCLISNSCFATGAQERQRPCKICDPQKSTTSWSGSCTYYPCNSDLDCLANELCESGYCTTPCKTLGDVCSGTPTGAYATCASWKGRLSCSLICKIDRGTGSPPQTWVCPHPLSCGRPTLGISKCEP